MPAHQPALQDENSLDLRHTHRLWAYRLRCHYLLPWFRNRWLPDAHRLCLQEHRVTGAAPGIQAQAGLIILLAVQ